jgi:DNA polymerase III delta prime subunit
MQDDFLWTEMYRPRSIKDTVLPDDLKKTFQKFVDTKNIPNMILSGSSGVGKTTVARAVLDELGCDYIVVNGSMDAGISTLRTDIRDFATTVSFNGKKKYVILDEADYLNPNSTQPALRNFMEEYSSNCGFILTCNFKNRIIQPLHSRCTVIDFKIDKKEQPKLAMRFMKRAEAILTEQNVQFDKSVLAQVIQKYFPDWRRIINELQRYSVTGSIDSGILSNIKQNSICELLECIKAKNYQEMRNWVYNNVDNDIHSLYRQFYDYGSEYFTKSTLPCLILLLAKYQYQHAFAADPEINFMAFLVEVMVECEFNG